MLISPFKAILFDYDDTLVCTRSIKIQQHKHAGRQFYNIELTEEVIAAHWGKPFEIMIEIFYEKKDTIENIKKNYFSLSDLYPVRPFNDSISVITYLQNHGLWTGVVTSMAKEPVIQDMKKNNFPYLDFNLIQGSADSKYHKPDGRVFDHTLALLREIDITPQQTLYVGDDLRDMKAAVEVGIHFIGIPNGLTTREEFKKHGAQTIKTLSELIR